MAVPLTLSVFRGDELLASRDFERDVIKIGRLSSAHLCLDDERVSRIHSVISAVAADSLSILDMGSPEGTFVNGKRIERGALKFGDEVKVGNTRIRVMQPGASLDTPSVSPFIVSRSTSTPNEVAAVPEGVAVEAAARRPMRAQQEAPPSPAIRSEVLGPSVRSHPRRQKGAGPLGLELRFFWRDQMVGDFFLRPNVEQTFTVGSAKSVDFEMGDTKLDGPSFDLVRFGKSGATLRFTSKMKGELQTRSGEEVMTLDQAQQRHLTSPDGVAQALRIEHGDFVWVDLGGVVMEAFFQPSPKPVRVSFADTVDFDFLNIFLALFFLASFSVIAAANFDAQGMVFDDELTSGPARFASWLTRPPEKNSILQRLERKRELGEIPQKHRNDQGQMGDRDAPKRAAHASPKSDPSRKDQVRDLLAKVFGHSGGGISTTFGRQELGGELKSALGHMVGAAAGDAAGFGGLALRGSASGGGGVGETTDIGRIGTKGRGGGTDRYGAAAGALAPKSSPEPDTRGTEIAVIGLLDKEFIRKVIRLNRAQIKYCYESQLNQFPKLHGKVSVKFVISPAGSVSSSSVAQSTVGNAELEACVAGRVQAWIFPKLKAEGQVIVTYPFIFAQSGEGR